MTESVDTDVHEPDSVLDGAVGACALADGDVVVGFAGEAFGDFDGGAGEGADFVYAFFVGAGDS